MNTDLKLAFETIMAKRLQHDEAFAYYDGVQPLVYANERLREIFRGRSIRFTENWCSLVVDAVKERLQLVSFTVPEKYMDAVKYLWNKNQLGLTTDAVHESVIICGEAYLIIWKDAVTGETEMYYNDPRLCHAFYRSDKPREMRFAAKMWVDEDNKCTRLILYYPDRFEYYRASGTAPGNSTSFEVDETEYSNGVASNPYGLIPVFHFRLSERVLKGDLYDVIPLQNSINKLLTDMMVAAEYGAFRQRWIISNADVSTLKNAPNEIWHIPAGDGVGQGAQVGEFSPTDLTNYLDAVERLALDISRITRIPIHYFYARGGFPSGESLYAMESPLTAKVAARIERFEVIWKQVLAFALWLETGEELSDGEIAVDWRPVQVVQPETESRIIALNTQGGIPLEIVLKRLGWTDAEIEDLKDVQAVSSESLGEQILTAFDRGQ